MRVGVLGGSGFVGKALTRQLINNEYDVISSYFHTNPPKDLEKYYLKIDLNEDYHVQKFLQGVDVVFYLVHSLAKKNFQKLEETIAKKAAKAMKENDIKLVFYLGGPKSESKHLRSRQQTYNILKQYTNTILIRSSAILGKESESYKLISAAGHSFLKITNSAMQNKTNPIYIDDLSLALLNLLKLPKYENEYEIGGPSITYKDMITAYQSELNVTKAPFAIPLNFNNFFVRAHLSFWGDVDYTLATHLIEGLTSNLEFKNNAAKKLLKHDPLTFKESIKLIENF